MKFESEREEIEYYEKHLTWSHNIFFPFVYKHWNILNSVLWWSNSIPLILAYIFNSWYMLFINIFIGMIKNWVDSVNNQRQHAPLSYAQRKWLLLYNIKSYVKPDYIKPNLINDLKRVNNEVHPSGVVWENELHESKPLRLWMWAKSKLRFKK